MSDDRYGYLKTVLKTLSKIYAGNMKNTLDNARMAIQDLQEEAAMNKLIAEAAVKALKDIESYPKEHYESMGYVVDNMKITARNALYELGRKQG